ncbi:MAG TPA: peptidoglycan-binding domain-containing protein, partial [Gemmatimonadaceae bacterium]|nr:peptidoglycan-binding domain-containing protein [Gemmatimonadaceae bacterium]
MLRKLIAAMAVLAGVTACAPRVSVPTGEIGPLDSLRVLGMDDVNVQSVNAEPSPVMLRSNAGPVIVRAQVLLDRARFSVGVINGTAGKNTELAIYWFQKSNGLPATSLLDSATYRRLMAVAGGAPVVTQVAVDADLLAGPFVVLPKNVYDQAKLRCLCYASLTEKLAERFHTTLEMMRKLNPGIGFAALKPGDMIWVPAVETSMTTDVRRVARIDV